MFSQEQFPNKSKPLNTESNPRISYGRIHSSAIILHSKFYKYSTPQILNQVFHLDQEFKTQANKKPHGSPYTRFKSIRSEFIQPQCIKFKETVEGDEKKEHIFGETEYEHRDLWFWQ